MMQLDVCHVFFRRVLSRRVVPRRVVVTLVMVVFLGACSETPPPSKALEANKASDPAIDARTRHDSVPAALSAELRTELRAELQSFLDEQAADWTNGDLKGFCAVYAEDAVFLSPKGKTVGRQQIFDRYHKRYRRSKKDGAKMGSLSLRMDDVRLGPDGNMASIALRWRLTWTEKMDGADLQHPKKPEASGLSLISLTRTGAPDAKGNKTWQIVQDASM